MKKTLFAVIDTETSKWDHLVFDLAWKTIDRKGNVYGSGSYLNTDVLNKDDPFFREKMSYYLVLVHKGLITPQLFRKTKFIFNKQIKELKDLGHRIIVTAFNATYDINKLNDTAQALNNENTFFDVEVDYLCLWEYWCKTCPKDYKGIPSASGKNIKTSAESVYRFEFKDESFVEEHVAFEDCEIEARILQKILARKKPMPVVSNPSQIRGNPWKFALDRIGFEPPEKIEKPNFIMGYI